MIFNTKEIRTMNIPARKITGAAFIAIAVVFASCESKKGKQGEANNNEQDSAQAMKDEPVKEPASYMKTKNGITVSTVTDFQEYKDAKLSMKAPENPEPGKVKFDFKVKNYELGKQTPDASKKNLANSEKGQHIHFIVDNGPYAAHYEPGFKKELEAGKHVLLAFLARSYHMSVKNKDAYVVKEINVGDVADSSNYDPDKPHLFYSRPKGTYTGKATEKILLDFYPVNAKISEDDYKVKATINGTSFMLNEWKPYMVEDLPMGENTFRIQLIDQDGNVVKGRFNDSGKRTITLKKASS